jgi:nucleoid-associated protein YgaU
MFGSVVDTERVFGHHPIMRRTRVRRRRLGAATLLLGLWLLAIPAVGHAIGSRSAPAPDPTAPAASTYVVQPGDTLWAIAERAAPGQDPRQVVEAVDRANGLNGGDIVPGQALVIPQA